MVDACTSATASRMCRCGIRSARAPPKSVLASMPTAERPLTTDSWAGPPPRATTCHTSETIQSPELSSDRAIEAASNR
jgi:hypothetical protein